MQKLVKAGRCKTCLCKNWLVEKLVCAEVGACKRSFVEELVSVKGGSVVWGKASPFKSGFV